MKSYGPTYYIINLNGRSVHDFTRDIFFAAQRYSLTLSPKEMYVFPHALQYDPKLVGIINQEFKESKEFQHLVNSWGLTITENPYI